uniref:Uncharacterized protein n=1 Tax=Rhodosorus marinus TaxID=101924 RepID=A0A7S3ENF0_9RHOD|mmetsp:Transcript_8184/g.36528  ORF Transcript_8184/g.36528 Transcript_8184/m.36528 type:complete len:144 (+) Transcript_8184:651-1082(+)|eukprot:CAMPEP_0113965312 /NCGR_PEP_ID=MMETSP0011_2-20120614/7671_1 /TAXON_ID=101924 /ORGANISM="Rhodosorus marinus" /LENGTH=143 /DNA_ID=CAMNT_0000977803 /DNA_START=257 /DNA_END=688 /DNA_ORIENTATION=+ /assembly_acc=CAM_ASM_000156
MRSAVAVVLLVAVVHAYWADPEPAMKCCEIDVRCLEQFLADCSNDFRLGEKLGSSERELCTRSGRGTWCVAEKESGTRTITRDWYCVSPREFLTSSEWYKFCKGGKYPNSKSTGGCYKKDCNKDSQKQLSSSCEEEVKKQICI